MRSNVYLFFDGRCEEAMRFYQEVLGGEMQAMMPHEGAPAADEVPAAWRAKIMHACLTVGDTQIMASDAPPQYYTKPQGFAVSLQIDAPAEAERVFAALGEGGAVQMELQETFWALRFGMLVDRFATPWMINCSRPQ